MSTTLRRAYCSKDFVSIPAFTLMLHIWSPPNIPKVQSSSSDWILVLRHVSLQPRYSGRCQRASRSAPPYVDYDSSSGTHIKKDSLPTRVTFMLGCALDCSETTTPITTRMPKSGFSTSRLKVCLRHRAELYPEENSNLPLPS